MKESWQLLAARWANANLTEPRAQVPRSVELGRACSFPLQTCLLWSPELTLASGITGRGLRCIAEGQCCGFSRAMQRTPW